MTYKDQITQCSKDGTLIYQPHRCTISGKYCAKDTCVLADKGMRYANADKLEANGIDPTPKAGDTVEWLTNNERWTVDESDDITGPSALSHWPDGGWCNVTLISRKAGDPADKEEKDEN